VDVRVGVSFVSVGQLWKSMSTEVEKMRSVQAGRLDMIGIGCESEELRVGFYTALFCAPQARLT
jgi:hypothetical protein